MPVLLSRFRFVHSRVEVNSILQIAIFCTQEMWTICHTLQEFHRPFKAFPGLN